MSKLEEKSAALAVFSSSAITPAKRDKLIELAKTQLTTLINHRQEAPYRAIFTGMTLQRLKAVCVHGEWMPLYEQILTATKHCSPGTARVMASYYMRLATEFLVEAGTANAETIALATSGHELSLATTDTKERAFMQKLEKFIDGRSLEELLTDHDIKNAGAAKKRKLKKGGDDATGEAKEQTVQERFNEIETALQLARKGTCDKGTWMSFDRKQHDALKAIFEHASEQVGDMHHKTHGRAAKK